jgi:hypothetical protein
MLTRLVIRNFKLFKDVDIELGDRVVFVGPNNAGKTTALQALALWSTGVRRLGHPARALLERPFVHYVANQPGPARDHFYGLREAKSDLVGVALFDRLETALSSDPNLCQLMWRRREVENYLCSRPVLLA